MMITGYCDASVQAHSRSGGGGCRAERAARWQFWEAWALRLLPRSDLLPCLLPQDLRRKAARLVAAKCTLAARVDSFHESTEGKVRAASASSWLVCGLSVACLSSIEERSHQKTPLHGDSQGWGAGVSSGPTQSGVPSPTLP